MDIKAKDIVDALDSTDRIELLNTIVCDSEAFVINDGLEDVLVRRGMDSITDEQQVVDALLQPIRYEFGERESVERVIEAALDRLYADD